MTNKNVTYLIDGFNLYHSIRRAQKELRASTKWLDIRALCESRLQNIRTVVGCPVDLESIYYFSAYAYHLKDPSIVQRHKSFVECLEDAGIKVEINRFKYKELQCPFCRRVVVKHEEKETDVSIALKLIEVFLEDECDIVVLMSGDTDLAPAVRMAKKLYPAKHILFDFPAYRKNKELANLCPGSTVINAKQYRKYQFSDPCILQSGFYPPPDLLPEGEGVKWRIKAMILGVKKKHYRRIGQ